MATMSEVAARAGVSQATVSFVLGGRADRLKISQQTRERVLGAARDLGYQRNQLARAMVTGKSRIIGVLTSPLAGENMIRVLAGAMEATNNNNYLLKVLHLSEEGIDAATITRCLEWRLAGAIVVGLKEDCQGQLRDEFQRANISLSMIDSATLPTWGVRVLSDDIHGFDQVLSHLIGLGHRRIALLGGTPGDLSDRREQIFRARLAQSGLQVPASWVRNTSWRDRASIEEGARLLLQEPQGRPTAIVCSGDNLAMMVLRVARILGLRVPEDLSVTGYSHAALSAYADPPLTTLDQSFQDMGHEAVMHLINCAESENPNFSIGSLPEILVQTKLIVRESTAPPLSFVG